MIETNLIEFEENSEGTIATIWLNRPEKRNALSEIMYKRLGEILDEIARKQSIRVVLLRARGEMFSSGIDLNFLSGNDSSSPTFGSPDLFRYTVSTVLHPIFQKMTMLEKPIIAVIEGGCFGGGFELALWCDFRFATKNADFRLLESKLNLVMDLGGATRLIRLVNPSHAKDILLTGRKVSAEEAYRMGFINRYYDDMNDLEKNLHEYCEMLISSGQMAVGLGKREIDLVYGLPEEFALRFEPIFQQECIQSKDFRRSIEALIKKTSHKKKT